MQLEKTIAFPGFSGIRCLMMPYIQGDSGSVPDVYQPYAEIIEAVFVKKGDIGFLTIDESLATAGAPHRGYRAKHGRALHTEAGKFQSGYRWGHPWAGRDSVLLDRDVQILLANNLNDSCALWSAEHEDTTLDGDIGHAADLYPYEDATFMKAGQVHQIGILTPHESLPVKSDFQRQFLRIISSGVHGAEPYFTKNPLMMA